MTVSCDGPDSFLTSLFSAWSQACSLRVGPVSAWSDRPFGLSSASARPEVNRSEGAGAQRSQPPGGGGASFNTTPVTAVTGACRRPWLRVWTAGGAALDLDWPGPWGPCRVPGLACSVPASWLRPSCQRWLR